MSSLLLVVTRCAGEIALGWGATVAAAFLAVHIIEKNSIEDKSREVFLGSLIFVNAGVGFCAGRFLGPAAGVSVCFTSFITHYKILEKKDFCASAFLWGAAVPVIRNLALLALNRR